MGVGVGAIEALTLGVCVPLGVHDSEGDDVELGETAAEGDDEPDALPLPLGVATPDGVGVGAIVALTLGECVPVVVGDSEGEEDAGDEPVEVGEAVPDAEAAKRGQQRKYTL